MIIRLICSFTLLEPCATIVLMIFIRIVFLKLTATLEFASTSHSFISANGNLISMPARAFV